MTRPWTWLVRTVRLLVEEVNTGLRYGSVIPSEVFSVCLLLWFGVSVSSPHPLQIDLLTLSPLDDLVRPPLLGILLITIQAIRLVSIARRLLYLRLACTLFSIFWWIMFAIGFTAVFHGPNIRLGSGLMLGVLQAWVAIRIVADHDRARRAVRSGIEYGDASLV